MKIIRQAEVAECAVASLCMIANHHGHRFDMVGIRRALAAEGIEGVTSLPQLIRAAAVVDLTARPVRCGVDDLKDLRLPAILHWNLDHFVVLTAIRGARFEIMDPAFGRRWYMREDLSPHFTGVAVEVTPQTRFDEIQDRHTLRLTDLYRQAVGMRRAVLHLGALALILQLFTLLSPAFVQIVLDEVVGLGDEALLPQLAAVFVCVYVLIAAIGLIRSWLMLNVGQSLTLQLSGNVVRHLLNLKADYFEKRDIGNIRARIESLELIQRVFTQTALNALVDGLLVIFAGLILFAYHPGLFAIVLSSCVLYMMVTWIAFPAERERTQRLIQAQADEQTFAIESIKSVRAVKLFGYELERSNDWLNRLIGVTNSRIKLDRVGIVRSAATDLIFPIQQVAVIGFGVVAVLSGGFSIGMLFAFLVYRQIFTTSATDFLNNVVEIRMLSVHLDRLSDIAFGELEEKGDPSRGLANAEEFEGAITLEGACFDYGIGGEPVLDGVDLTIEPGEFVAITGVSGCGKTTMLKVILGLLPVTGGRVRYDQYAFDDWPLAALRAKMGVVMQDDSLLSGSIADNVAFFDPDMDDAQVTKVCMAVGIHDDIMKLPMKYNTIVSDMACPLSGGQRQRILLARALYRRPTVLLLDEGTANLDVDTERLVASTVSNLDITRIVVAHRPELIRRADRVVSLEGGKIFERDNSFSVDELSVVRA